MEIQPELLKLGINEAIIEFFHNRTKNKHLIITKVTKAITIKNEKLDGIKVNVRLEDWKLAKKTNNDIPLSSSHPAVQYQQYTINVAKIRNKKLNLLLKK
jgi:hypothetical protein